MGNLPLSKSGFAPETTPSLGEKVLVNNLDSVTTPRLGGKVLINGLDDAGKTTLLQGWRLGEVIINLGIGFNIEKVKIPSDGREGQITSFTAIDVGGRTLLRSLLRRLFKDVDCVVWVVDSNDTGRLEQAQNELLALCGDSELTGVPLLVLCNKQDLPNALRPYEICDCLKLHSIRGRRVYSMGVSAYTGIGLKESLGFVIDLLRGRKADLLTSHNAFGELRGPFIPELPEYPTTLKAGNIVLFRFLPIQDGTQCPFARSAKLWGGKSPELGATIEEQAKANGPALSRFVYECQHDQFVPNGFQHTDTRGYKKSLDGFCVELHAGSSLDSPIEFGEYVRQFLTALSHIDPSKEDCMRRPVGSRGWRFRYAGADFFITSFAPCYPETSSRFAFDTGRAFLLFQPETSFLRHGLPDDTPKTNWTSPQTIRDKTRIAFKEAGRPYFIPDTTAYPPAEHIVKPIRDDGSVIVKWWVKAPVANDDDTEVTMDTTSYADSTNGSFEEEAGVVPSAC